MRKGDIAILAALVLVAIAWIAWDNGRGTFSHANYGRIHPGMSLAEVERLLGGRGDKMPEGELPKVVDWSVPLEAPERTKQVVSGEQFFRWRGEVNGAQIIISLRDGIVAEKWYWEQSL